MQKKALPQHLVMPLDIVEYSNCRVAARVQLEMGFESRKLKLTKFLCKKPKENTSRNNKQMLKCMARERVGAGNKKKMLEIL